MIFLVTDGELVCSNPIVSSSSFISSTFFLPKTLVYKSIVICKEACPRYDCTVFGGIPASKQRVANVCLNVFTIERACPGTVGYMLDYHPHTGQEFATLIEECWYWFYDNDKTYDLPDINSYIPSALYDEAYNFLNSIGDIKPLL